jgi:hypothetical protein
VRVVGAAMEAAARASTVLLVVVIGILSGSKSAVARQKRQSQPSCQAPADSQTNLPNQ